MNKIGSIDPVTGPLSREELRKLANAPFGTAIKEIRKFDPMYGRAPGEKIEWKVICKSNMEGRAYVKAASKKEAEALADKLGCNDVDWGTYSDDFEILSIEPHK